MRRGERKREGRRGGEMQKKQILMPQDSTQKMTTDNSHTRRGMILTKKVIFF